MRGNRKCSHGSEIAAFLNLVVIYATPGLVELTAYRRTGSCAPPSLRALLGPCPRTTSARGHERRDRQSSFAFAVAAGAAWT